MRTPASFGGHPVHSMLVHFPIGLLSASFFFDLIALWRGDEVWLEIAFYNLALGLIGAGVAAIPGFIDYVSLKDEKVLPVAHWHFGVNLALICVYALDLWIRTDAGKSIASDYPLAPFLSSIVGIALVGVSGHLGGEMVYVLGIGINADDRRGDS